MVGAEWTGREWWDEHRRRRHGRYLDAFPECAGAAVTLAPMFNYPEIVTLAALLANAHRTDIAASGHRFDRGLFDRRQLDASTLPGAASPSTTRRSWAESHAHVQRMGQCQQRDDPSPGARLASGRDVGSSPCV